MDYDIELPYLYEYHPYRVHGERNPYFDQVSGLLLDLKEGQQHATSFFADKLAAWLSNEYGGERVFLAIVPSHEKHIVSSGLCSVAELASLKYPIDWDIDMLLRTHTIPKLSHGGCRDVQVHLDSIEVRVDFDCEVPIVVIDDIQTTGNSMRACVSLLIDYGAKSVSSLAFGQTVREL